MKSKKGLREDYYCPKCGHKGLFDCPDEECDWLSCADPYCDWEGGIVTLQDSSHTIKFLVEKKLRECKK